MMVLHPFAVVLKDDQRENRNFAASTSKTHTHPHTPKLSPPHQLAVSAFPLELEANCQAISACTSGRAWTRRGLAMWHPCRRTKSHVRLNSRHSNLSPLRSFKLHLRHCRTNGDFSPPPVPRIVDLAALVRWFLDYPVRNPLFGSQF